MGCVIASTLHATPLGCRVENDRHDFVFKLLYLEYHFYKVTPEIILLKICTVFGQLVQALTDVTVVVNVIAVLPAPHDIGLGIPHGVTVKAHVGALPYHQVCACVAVHDSRRNCN